MSTETKKPSIPFFVSRPQAGFPSPAEDSYEFKLDLNSYVVKNPTATFFVKVEGDSMEGVGIYSGDLLVVDRSLEPSDGRIVLAVVDGDFTVKTLRQRGKKTLLVAENPLYSPVEITGDKECFVWGVVVGALHKF